MNDFERLGSELQRQIDRLCDEFEDDADGKVSLQYCLQQVEHPPAKRILFAELLDIELGRNHSDRRPARLNELALQFPEYLEMIDQLREASSIAHGSDKDSVRNMISSPVVGSTLFSKYKLIERVGEGAFGQVWKARDQQLDRVVAIKVPKQQGLSQADTQRFLKEAQLAAKLKHPNIVAVHEVRSHEGIPVIISDFVDGVAVLSWSQRAIRTPTQIAEMGHRIANAIQHAHDAGIIHRDLKSANVLVDSKDEPHVTDFGLAKNLSDETMTTAGALLGSPAYMSPEQALGDAHRADQRTDVYSLGVILYELMTGERPFRGTPESVMYQVIHHEPVVPRQLNPRIPVDLQTICLKCLNKDPDQRYPSAGALADDLRRFEAGEPILARPVSAAERGWSWCKRNRGFASAIGLALSLLLFLAVGGPWLATVRARERNQARRDATLNGLASLQQKLLRNGQIAAKAAAEDLLQTGDPEIVRGFPFRHLLFEARNPVRQQFHITSSRVAFSPAEQLIAFGAKNKEIVLWDVEQNRELRRFPYHGSSAFSPDGTLLAIRVSCKYDVSRDKKLTAHHVADLKIVNVKTGTTEKSFELIAPVDRNPPPGPEKWRGSNRVQWSHDAKLIAFTVIGSKSPVLFDLDSQQIRELSENRHPFSIRHFAFSPTSNRIASCTGSIRVWDAETGEYLDRITLGSGYMMSVAWSPDGRYICYADTSSVIVYDTQKNGYSSLQGFEGVNCSAYSHDGKYIVAGSYNRLVKVWRSTEFGTDGQTGGHDIGKLLLRGHSSVVHDVGFTSGGHIISVGAAPINQQGEHLAIDWGKPEEITNIVLRYNRLIRGMDVSPDGKYVATLSEWVKVTDIESREQVAQFTCLDRSPNGPEKFLIDVEFDPRNDRLAMAALDERTILFWNRESDSVREVTPELAPNVSLTDVAYTSDGRALVASDTSGRLWFCDTETYELRFWQTHNSISRIGFLDGTTRLAVLASATKDTYQISVLDIVAQKELLGPTPAQSTSLILACSPDGRFVATGGFGGIVHLWDARDGKHAKTLGSPGEDIRSATFTRDSYYLVTGSQVIRFWDLQSFDEAIGLGEGVAPNHHIDLAPNGEFLLSGALDGTLRIWKAPHLEAR